MTAIRTAALIRAGRITSSNLTASELLGLVESVEEAARTLTVALDQARAWQDHHDVERRLRRQTEAERNEIGRDLARWTALDGEYHGGIRHHLSALDANLKATIAREWDLASANDALTVERDALVIERDEWVGDLVIERDAWVGERDAWVDEARRVVVARDAALAALTARAEHAEAQCAELAAENACRRLDARLGEAQREEAAGADDRAFWERAAARESARADRAEAECVWLDEARAKACRALEEAEAARGAS